jgi:ppGpp synthetase/RelA/SpoT-type nucleotidyltranferase
MKEIIEIFRNNVEIYDSFKERIVNLLKDLISNSQLTIHQIDSRVKTIESLTSKLVKKDKYTDISEITDIVGIRVITYLESDVDKVESLVRKEFDIDLKNSIDKRLLDVSEFGYRSLHLVASLSPSRLALSEYKRYSGLKFEIQIRSILQHAWAEIEHDLGYKSKSAVPETSVRNFNRVAALLESADIEFDRLKKELSRYEKDVTQEISKAPETVAINQASLDSFVKNDKTFNLIRQYVIDECDAEFNFVGDYSDLIEKLTFFNITNIGQLQDLVNENSKDFILFVKDFIKKGITKTLALNLPLFWFQHFLAAKSLDEELINKYLNLGSRPIAAEPIDFIERYKRIKAG